MKKDADIVKWMTWFRDGRPATPRWGVDGSVVDMQFTLVYHLSQRSNQLIIAGN